MQHFTQEFGTGGDEEGADFGLLPPPPLPQGYSERAGVVDMLLRAAVEQGEGGGDAKAKGRGGVLCVRGQGGIGKTTCAAALLRGHRARLLPAPHRHTSPHIYRSTHRPRSPYIPYYVFLYTNYLVI